MSSRQLNHLLKTPAGIAGGGASALGTSAAKLQEAAQSASTTRSYERGVRHFLDQGGAIPATPRMVINYLVRCAGKLAVATIEQRLIALHRAHLDRKLRSPVMAPEVKRTMQGLRRTYGVAQRRVKAIVKDDLLEMLVMVDQQRPIKAARDRALLLVGFAGAFRRSELVALRTEEIAVFPHGVELMISRSKTDQAGMGRTVFIPAAKGDRCPVKSLRDWIDLAGITSGPIFRGVNRHDQVGQTQLSPQSVALIVKRATKCVRGDAGAKLVSGHSLRAGFVTEAAAVGLQPYQIREVTGHRSDVTLARYIRPVQKRKIPSLL